MEKETFDLTDLVSFGNYLLGDKRIDMIIDKYLDDKKNEGYEDVLYTMSGVTDADLQNWWHSTPKEAENIEVSQVNELHFIKEFKIIDMHGLSHEDVFHNNHSFEEDILQDFYKSNLTKRDIYSDKHGLFVGKNVLSFVKSVCEDTFFAIRISDGTNTIIGTVTK